MGSIRITVFCLVPPDLLCHLELCRVPRVTPIRAPPQCLCFLGRESSSERLQMWVKAWQQRTGAAPGHAPAASYKRSAATEGASSPLTACLWLWQLLSRASVAPAPTVRVKDRNSFLAKVSPRHHVTCLPPDTLVSPGLNVHQFSHGHEHRADVRGGKRTHVLDSGRSSLYQKTLGKLFIIKKTGILQIGDVAYKISH
ncbi:unnamed protein product [Gadus morhua 'NCC']